MKKTSTHHKLGFSKVKPIFPVVILLLAIFFPAYLTAEKGGKARTFILKEEYLALSKKLWKEGDRLIQRSVKKLLKNADQELKSKPWPVTKKKYPAPSGDFHDFVSYGTYYWPNPDTKDGQPWVMRDGYINPDAGGDWTKLNRLASQLELLSLAYYFTGNEVYAAHAALFLRTWFIDKETRMNPNVNYGKITPGVVEGGYAVAGFGLVFRRIYDAAGMLESSKSWTKEDKKGFQQWTREFIHWVETSPLAEIERVSTSNHGTFYEMIMTVQSLYIGDTGKARERILFFKNNRMLRHYKPDGSQPVEMKRADNYTYHRLNLMIALDIAQLADHFRDIDLWNYKTPKGAGLRKAVEFLVPYFCDWQKWPYFKKDVFHIPGVERWPILRRAAIGFKDRCFEAAASLIPSYDDDYIVNLCYPKAAVPFTPRDRFFLKFLFLFFPH